MSKPTNRCSLLFLAMTMFTSLFADEVRINVGGPEITDAFGNTWAADNGQFVTGGTAYTASNNISNTNLPDALYQSEKWGPMTWEIPVANQDYVVKLHFAENWVTGNDLRLFNINVEGQVINNYDIYKEANGGSKAIVQSFVVHTEDGDIDISFTEGSAQSPKVNAIEIVYEPAHEDHLYLHVEIDVPNVIDEDESGDQLVSFDGSKSHTHEPGNGLTGYEWRDADGVITTDVSGSKVYPIGTHDITLRIFDDQSQVVPNFLDKTVSFKVSDASEVPGVLVKMYKKGDGTLENLASNLPSTIDYAFQDANLQIIQSEIPFSSNIVVEQDFELDIKTQGSYTLSATGASITKIFVEGTEVTAPVSLMPGKQKISVRYGLDNVNSNLAFTYSLGGVIQTPGEGDVTYSVETLPPVVNSMTESGSELGDFVTITGMGFKPADSVNVQWGSQTFNLANKPDMTITDEQITFQAPAGSGSIIASVSAPNGNSASRTYTYNAQDLPVVFNSKGLANIAGATQIATGPDGRVYVTTYSGKIHIIQWDENWNSILSEEIIDLATLVTDNTTAILGLAFNPYESSSDFSIYIAHNWLWAFGSEGCGSQNWPYPGRISKININTKELTPLATNLPVSKHDHGVSGIEFDNNGDLIMAVGGTTNAGIKDCTAGDVPESPLSGAIVIAKLSDPNFNGFIDYIDEAGDINNDARNGEFVTLDAKNAPYFEVFAPGFRNAYDFVYTRWSQIYATDNGPDLTFGPALTGQHTPPSNDPETEDEFIHVKKDHYYGHPNPNRARNNPDEWVYYGHQQDDIPDNNGDGIPEYTKPTAIVLSSTNGTMEYRSRAFGGKIDGDVFAKYLQSGTIYHAELASDHATVEQVTTFAPLSQSGLDIEQGLGGAILTAQYYSDQGPNTVLVAVPDDSDVTSPFYPYDIHPWRAPKEGGNKFFIGGFGFGTSLANVSVSFGGTPATVTAVSDRRIEGTIPAGTFTDQLVSVSVTVNSFTIEMPNAFKYLEKDGIPASSSSEPVSSSSEPVSSSSEPVSSSSEPVSSSSEPVSSSSEPVSSSSEPVSSSSSIPSLPNYGDKSAPGKLEAEFFDAFNELTGGNNGNWNDRNAENTGVDMEMTGDAGGGANVGWTDAGEWLEYNFDVATAGTYEFVLRVASAQGTRNVSVSVNGAAAQSFSYTGSAWQSYADLETVTTNLTVGQNTVRITFIDGATNLNYIEVNSTTPVSSSSEPVSSSSEPVSSSSEPVSSSSSVVSSSSEPISSSSSVSTGNGVTGTEYDACVQTDGTVDVGVPGKTNSGDHFGGYKAGQWFFGQQQSACVSGVCNLSVPGGASAGQTFQYFCQGGGCDSDGYFPGSNNQPGVVLTLRSCN